MPPQRRLGQQITPPQRTSRSFHRSATSHSAKPSCAPGEPARQGGAARRHHPTFFRGDPWRKPQPAPPGPRVLTAPATVYPSQKFNPVSLGMQTVGTRYGIGTREGTGCDRIGGHGRRYH